MSTLSYSRLATRYIAFMKLVGSAKNDDEYLQLLPEYFSEHIIKIENGNSIATGREGLKNQLKKARDYLYPWKMELLDVVSDPINHCCAIRFTWNSDTVVEHITMAILKFDATEKIIEINEVCNKFAELSH